MCKAGLEPGEHAERALCDVTDTKLIYLYHEQECMGNGELSGHECYYNECYFYLVWMLLKSGASENALLYISDTILNLSERAKSAAATSATSILRTSRKKGQKTYNLHLWENPKDCRGSSNALWYSCNILSHILQFEKASILIISTQTVNIVLCRVDA